MAIVNGIGNRTLQTHTMRAMKQMVRGLLGGPSAFAFVNSTHPVTHGGAHGVVGDNDFKVSAQGTPDMTVKIGAGEAFILQDANAHAGTGTVYNDGDLTTAAFAAQHATLNRIDLVTVQMRDNVEDGSGANDWRYNPVVGTPSASPAVPAIPANSLVLAQVLVRSTSNGGGTITAADITDKRTFICAIGGRRRCVSTARPTAPGLRLGDGIYELDTKRLFTWNGTAWAGERTVAFSGTGTGVTGFSNVTVMSQLNIPDQGCAGKLHITGNLRIDLSNPGDVFMVQIWDAGGAIVGGFAAIAFQHVSVTCTVAMPAGAVKTVSVAAVRVSGTGTASTFTDAPSFNANRIDVLFVPDA